MHGKNRGWVLSVGLHFSTPSLECDGQKASRPGLLRRPSEAPSHPPPPTASLNTTESTQTANLTHLLSDLTEAYKASSNSLASPAAQFASGQGFPPIPKKLADRILAGEFVDLADLPPAKGKVRPLSTPEGSVLLVHAHDFMHQKRLIPDLATWVQSLSLYTAVMCSKSPERLTDVLGYMCQITRASQRFKIMALMGHIFRQEAADRDIKIWSQMDPSLFAQCFTGQAKGTECHGAKHATHLTTALTCALSSPQRTSTQDPAHSHLHPRKHAGAIISSLVTATSATDAAMPTNV